jgi:hypothetical protein
MNNNDYANLAKAIVSSTDVTKMNSNIEEEPSDIDTNPRLCITVFDANNNIVERSYGPSQHELRVAHDAHKCGAWCGICYEEACTTLNNTIDEG